MHGIRDLLGPFPQRADLEAETVERMDCGRYVRETVEYTVETGERVRALVGVPKGLSEPAPAVFCHHQHNGEFALGKSEVFGLRGDPDQALAVELADHGFITFAPDAVGFEERNWSNGTNQTEYFELATRLVVGKTLTAKVLHDASVGLDYLQTRPDVRRDRLGFIGHSYGGRMALWMPAHDARLRASVSNCGCIDYQHSLTHDTGIQMAFCIPGFMERFELIDVVDQIRDCHVLISVGADDKWSRGHRDLVEGLIARGHENVELVVHDGDHAFTPTMRTYAYEFLGRWLFGRDQT